MIGYSGQDGGQLLLAADQGGGRGRQIVTDVLDRRLGQAGVLDQDLLFQCLQVG